MEYAVLDCKKLKKEEIEYKLNEYSKLAWRVKCAVGTKLILYRKN